MKTKILLLTITVFSIFFKCQASHVAGMRITYEYSGTGNDYIFKLNLFRDCSGLPAPTYMTVSFSSASCSLGFVQSLTLTSTNQIPLNSCAGPGSTTCQGGSIFGIEEYIYSSVVTVPPCSDWVVESNICCRNANITNLTNPDFYNTHVETRFDNLNFPGNSSPGFIALPVNYYCVGEPSMKDYSTLDIDGDSIHYELVPVLSSPNSLLIMAPGYTFDQPLAVLSSTYLDPNSGYLMFTPSMIQQASIGLLVSEYRNGTLIGTIRVDDEIVVGSGIANPDSITGRVYIDHNSSGIFDSGDQAVSNVLVEMTPGNTFSSTSGNGKYDLFTIDGIWNISIPNPPPFTTVSPATIVVNTNNITSSINNDFILDLIPNINELEVYLNQTGTPIPGLYYPLYITYKNTGTTIQSNIDVTVTLDSLLQFIYSTPLPTSVNGNILTYTIPLLPVFTIDDIDIVTSVDTTATAGLPVYCSAEITTLANEVNTANNFDSIDDLVATSFDPNFKEVTPPGDLDVTFINAQDWLTYRIHFQNLGTAPATIIRISDILDYDLEISSLEFVTSSFPCTMTLVHPNQLEFSFFGINLPAASVNEPMSHGFVEYRIRPKSFLMPGTYITNNAGIYFDFNAPVYTNMVFNKVVNTVGVEENADHPFQVSVYPNPAATYFILEVISTESAKTPIKIYNLLGILIKNYELELTQGINRLEIPVEELSDGNYFIAVGEKTKLISKLSMTKF